MTESSGRRCPVCGREVTVAARGRPRVYCSRACQARAYLERSDRGPNAVPPGRRHRKPRQTGNLELSGIVATGIAIANADGIDALSMRAVAVRLDVPVMSLYRHVRNKQELVRAMVETVFAEQFRQPAAAGDLRTVLAREARQEWALYRRHPWLLRVLGSSRPTAGRSVMDSVDRIVRALTDAGAEVDLAFRTYLLLSGYVQGAALLMVSEHEAVRDTGVSRSRWWSLQRGRLERDVDLDRYPWLAVPLGRGGPGSVDDLEAWFEFGLQRVLDGIVPYVERQHGR